MLYEKLLRGKPRRLGQNAPLSRLMKIRLKFARFLPAKTGGDIGRACIWSYDFPIMLQNHIHKLRPYVSVCTKYFYYVFYLYNLTGLIGGKGIGIQGYSSKALHDTLVPLPPVKEQQRIVAQIEKLFEQLR